MMLYANEKNKIKIYFLILFLGLINSYEKKYPFSMIFRNSINFTNEIKIHTYFVLLSMTDTLEYE